MSSVTLLPSAERAQVPWKNGGGVTQTVAAFPDEAGPDEFMWRVSIAEVQTAGPFSVFPETDRHLSVLEGTLLLGTAGQPPVTLSGVSDGLAFPGDVATTGTPVGGPVLDLNVMTRRGRYQAQVEKLHSGRTFHVGGEVAILVATAATVVEYDGSKVTLGHLDALRIVEDAGQHRRVSATVPVHLIQIFSAAH